MVKMANVYWVGMTDPYLAHWGPSRGSQMSKTNPFRAPNCPKISLLAPEKVIRWPKVASFGTKLVMWVVTTNRMHFGLNIWNLGLFWVLKGLHLLIKWLFGTP